MEWKEREGRGNAGKVAPKYNRSGLVGGHKALLFFTSLQQIVCICLEPFKSYSFR